MASSKDLCRGWTADDIRRALLAASDRQKAVLAEIGREDGITTMEIAENLGLKSPRSVGATMAAWSRTTKALGVTDPDTGRPSWPITFSQRSDGYWRYHLTPEVRAIFQEVLAS